MNGPTQTGKPTMSGREIADLAGKPRNNVIRDIHDSPPDALALAGMEPSA